MIDVVSWGIAGSIVDSGRPGRCWMASPRGGAVDAEALALANRLVGNSPGAAGLESSGGMVLHTRRALTVALTGASAVVDVVDGPPVGWWTPVSLPRGATLRIGALIEGCRTYLAVRGGLSPTDGGAIAVGDDPVDAPLAGIAPRRVTGNEVGIWPGPRLDWFVEDTWRCLLDRPWRVGATSRVGTRLLGAPLRRAHDRELPTEGIIEGAIQVPPDGQPIILLADHPTTGGYPVVAVVEPADLSIVAQARPGSDLVLRTARRRVSRR